VTEKRVTLAWPNMELLDPKVAETNQQFAWNFAKLKSQQSCSTKKFPHINLVW
jgi:hypothetical protein